MHLSFLIIFFAEHAFNRVLTVKDITLKDIGTETAYRVYQISRLHYNDGDAGDAGSPRRTD